MTTRTLASLTVPSTVAITYMPPPTGKVALMLQVKEVRAMVMKALTAWYYGS